MISTRLGALLRLLAALLSLSLIAAACGDDNGSSDDPDVETDEPVFLYLKVAYHRGWRATVDGNPAPVLSLSPGFSGCVVPAGTHTVAFHYMGRRGACVGAGMSLGTLAAFLLIRIGQGLHNRKREPGTDTPKSHEDTPTHT